MASMPNSVRQAAVIPIRLGRVCLVLSSGGKRWVVGSQALVFVAMTMEMEDRPQEAEWPGEMGMPLTIECFLPHGSSPDP